MVTSRRRIGALKNGVVTVNPNAQRTLAKGAITTPTHELVDQQKVHETPRMKDLVQFLNRVMENVEQKDISEGFLGAVLMVIPEDFTDATWEVLVGTPKEASIRSGSWCWRTPGLDREENSKSIAKGSSKLFTLSALTQAYGWSVANTTKTQRLDADMYQMVGGRKEFPAAFWRKASEVFASLWRRPADADNGEWLDFLLRRRAEQNVALQAIFLQVLGRFGYNLGKRCGWNPDADGWAEEVDALSPEAVNYRAFTGRVGDAGKDGKREYIQVVNDPAAEFNPVWTNALMKPRASKDADGKPTTQVAGYSFNNVSDSISKTYQELLRLAGLEDTAEAADDGDEVPAEGLAEMEA